MKLTVISCTDQPCGACCTEQAALPVSWYLGYCAFGDRKTLPPKLLADLQSMLDDFMDDEFPADGSPCVWFDAETRRCKHYEFRPDVCREENVVPGNESCLLWRAAKGIDASGMFRKNT